MLNLNHDIWNRVDEPLNPVAKIAGIGLETARALYAKNATVALLCRNLTKTAKVVEELKSSAPESQGRLDIFECDLSRLASVRECAEALQKRYDKIHVLINNAGQGGELVRRLTARVKIKRLTVRILVSVTLNWLREWSVNFSLTTRFVVNKDFNEERVSVRDSCMKSVPFLGIFLLFQAHWEMKWPWQKTVLNGHSSAITWRMFCWHIYFYRPYWTLPLKSVINRIVWITALRKRTGMEE